MKTLFIILMALIASSAARAEDWVVLRKPLRRQDPRPRAEAPLKWKWRRH